MTPAPTMTVLHWSLVLSVGFEKFVKARERSSAVLAAMWSSVVLSCLMVIVSSCTISKSQMSICRTSNVGDEQEKRIYHSSN